MAGSPPRERPRRRHQRPRALRGDWERGAGPAARPFRGWRGRLGSCVPPQFPGVRGPPSPRGGSRAARHVVRRDECGHLSHDGRRPSLAALRAVATRSGCDQPRARGTHAPRRKLLRRVRPRPSRGRHRRLRRADRHAPVVLERRPALGSHPAGVGRVRRRRRPRARSAPGRRSRSPTAPTGGAASSGSTGTDAPRSRSSERTGQDAAFRFARRLDASTAADVSVGDGGAAHLLWTEARDRRASRASTPRES